MKKYPSQIITSAFSRENPLHVGLQQKCFLCVKLGEVPRTPEFQVLLLPGPHPLSHSDINCMFAVPKATFRFSDLLEGLTEYTESLVHAYSLLYPAKTLKSARKNTVGQNPIPNREPPVILSWWRVVSASFPQRSREQCAAEEAHLGFGVQSLHGALWVLLDIVSPPITEAELPPAPHATTLGISFSWNNVESLAVL